MIKKKLYNGVNILFVILVGSDAPTGLVESTAVFLFTKLKDCEEFTYNEASQLHSTIGPFPNTDGEDAHRTIQSLVKLLPPGVLENVEKLQKLEESEEFGRHIHFSHEPRSLEFAEGR